METFAANDGVRCSYGVDDDPVWCRSCRVNVGSVLRRVPSPERRELLEPCQWSRARRSHEPADIWRSRYNTRSHRNLRTACRRCLWTCVSAGGCNNHSWQQSWGMEDKTSTRAASNYRQWQIRPPCHACSVVENRWCSRPCSFRNSCISHASNFPS